MATPYRLKLSDLITRGEAADAKLAEAIDAYNGAVLDAWNTLKETLEVWNAEREEIVDAIHGQAEPIRTLTDSYSEKWAESPKGLEVISWLDDMESFEINEFMPDEPNELEKPDEDLAEILGNLSEGPGE